MSSSTEGRTAYAPAASTETPPAIRWVCTSNPFYVISAGLFLAGLWLSCDPEKAKDTWALMTGLVGYTLLLAGTAYLLIRFAKVWDDTRTVLLLVVLMFLATSVTFDRALVFTPLRGLVCNLAGLAFAVLVSEALLLGIRLELPAAFRVPYYFLLALFFLYPVGLAHFLNLRALRSEPVMWGMFGFATAAGVIFLTLLPAVRRGAAYVRHLGSPWPWPLYPWSLFGLLAFAVPCRALLLCYSMHLIDVRDLYEATFGFYFLVPFGLVIAVLLLEAGLVARRQRVILTALAIPAVLLVLSLVGHRDERVYQQFLSLFTYRLGVGPAYFALVAAAAFYGYAALRRVSWAVEALTTTLALMMCVAPDSVNATWRNLVAPQPAPLMTAATLLLGLGIWRRVSWQCLVGSLGLTAGVAIMFPTDVEVSLYRWPIVYHLVLVAMLSVGAAFDDELAQRLRVLGSFLALLVCLGVTIVSFQPPPSWPAWAFIVYPLAMAPLLAAYGYWLGHRLTLGIAGVILVFWTMISGWQIYRILRQVVAGLDYLVLSVGVFGIAVLISLAKSELLSRWREARQEGSGDETE